MKKQFLNSNLTKKGFIFTTDVTIAVIMVFAILTVTTFFITRNNEEFYPKLQLERTASDIIHLLDYKGYLENPTPSEIENKLNELLPTNYEIHLQGIGNNNCVFEVGNSPTQEEFIISSKEIFKTDSEYCTLNYEIWLK